MSNKIKNILKEYVQGLINLIGDNLKNVILYGSYARGEQDANGEISDIDIMILVDLNEEEIKTVVNEVLTPINYNLMVTPKEIDFVIENLAA